jgi:hypothetical protein
MHGYFGLVTNDRHRKLWIVPIEPVDNQLIGQLVPFIYTRGENKLSSDVRQASDRGKIHVGDKFAQYVLPRMFVELPLREIYEPPTRSNRPPWGKDDRSPGGVPGAPTYGEYEGLVREYMVQIMRGRKPGRLEIPVLGVSERYDYFSDDAQRDAEALIKLGVSPFQRPYTRSLGDWLREIAKARAQGQDSAEMDCLEGKARANAGSFDEGIKLMRKGLNAAQESFRDRDYYISEIAKSEYLAHRFEKALQVLEELKEPSSQQAYLVGAASLARLGRLSKEKIQENRASNVRVNDIRIDSQIERRETLDFWAEGLEMAGFQP